MLIIVSLVISSIIVIPKIYSNNKSISANLSKDSTDDDSYIKWVDFDVSEKAMKDTMDVDIASQDEPVKIDWIELLAYLGAKYGGDFSKYSKSDLNTLVEQLQSGSTIEDLSANFSKNYSYYYEVYDAVLDQFVGNYQSEEPSESNSNETCIKEHYGLKAFSPIAATFPYNDYDDFGASRTYGYKRKHLGHDMMAATGTPVIAVESGVVEVLGWNQYGGWRIGIRSFDNKRYYYYAHLRQNRPYAADLYEGKTVTAGDVIGYVGHTGYSTEENVNNIETSHLHIGLELIFDESQKESDNEIWIDLYDISNLLSSNKSQVVRNPETKEYTRKYKFSDTVPLS